MRRTSSGRTVYDYADPLATHGMVTSPHYLATQAGVDILRRGGNAVDAAIAACSVLAVVYPHMCTLGGDGFWLIYSAKKKELKGLNASGRAGKRATIEHYRQLGFKSIPFRGALAANTVPGVVSGWEEACRYAGRAMGTKLAWKELFQSAIMYAADGFPVGPSLQKWSRTDTASADKEGRFLQRFPEFARIFLHDDRPHGLGDVLCQKDLAVSLDRIASFGGGEFYRGETGEKIVRSLEKQGGLLTREDFAMHRADWVEPISVEYRGKQACNLPPNTQGMASLAILNILDNMDVCALGESTASYVHAIVEATKEAFLDRDRYLTDPDFADIPLAQILSKAHGRAQAARIGMESAAASLTPLDPHGDTVWLGVIDQHGNAASVIQSIYHDFGSGIVAEGTGILLQNRGCFFSLDPSHVNRLEPGKRTFHTLNPAMLLDQGKPLLVYGTMGGEGQPQTQAALVTRIVDFGMTPQEAIDAPRWLYGRSWGSVSNGLRIESRFNEEVYSSLRQKGHAVEKAAPYSDVMGHAGALLVHQNGVIQGGSDPRGDGLAAGY